MRRERSGLLTEVPAAAEVAAAEAAHVAATEASPAEASYMATAEAAHVAEVSAGEMSPVPVETEALVMEAVVEPVPSEEDRTTKPVVIVVIRILVSVTIVVARAIIRPVVGVATVRIAGRGASDHPACDGRAGVIAIVNVAVPVSPNVVAMACVVARDIPMACVATCDIPMQAVRDAGVSGASRGPGVVHNGRRARGRERRRQHKSGRAEREGRNSESPKSHGDILSGWATQQRRGNAPSHFRWIGVADGQDPNRSQFRVLFAAPVVSAENGQEVVEI
jgi:hypothetical protein